MTVYGDLDVGDRHAPRSQAGADHALYGGQRHKTWQLVRDEPEMVARPIVHPLVEESGEGR